MLPVTHQLLRRFVPRRQPRWATAAFLTGGTIGRYGSTNDAVEALRHPDDARDDRGYGGVRGRDRRSRPAHGYRPARARLRIEPWQAQARPLGGLRVGVCAAPTIFGSDVLAIGRSGSGPCGPDRAGPLAPVSHRRLPMSASSQRSRK